MKIRISQKQLIRIHQNKVGSLNSVSDYQPFYPKNYRPAQQIVGEYSNIQPLNKGCVINPYSISQSNGLVWWYNQSINPSSSVFIPKSIVPQVVERKQNSQKKVDKRATSNNSNTSNKENLNQYKRKKIINEKSEWNNAFSFPDGGWVWSFCQNYNFFGRVKWNRWTKIKTKEDCDGKPQHIIKKEQK